MIWGSTLENTQIFDGSPHFKHSFLDAFEKLQKVATSFVIFLCPSLSPPGTTRLPLDAFSRNLMFGIVFAKAVEQIQVLIKSEKEMGTLHTLAREVVRSIGASPTVYNLLRNELSKPRIEDVIHNNEETLVEQVKKIDENGGPCGTPGRNKKYVHNFDR
jgi:hypothetical protein